MTLRLSMMITGDSSSLKQAADVAEISVKKTGEAVGELSGKLQSAAQAHGQVNSQELATAQTYDQVAAAVTRAAAANDNIGERTGLARRQMSLLNETLRAGVDTIALGVPPTAQLALVLERLSLSAGEEGASAVLSRLKGTIVGLLTPTNLVIGAVAGVVAFGAAMLYAGSQSVEADRQIERSLIGVGQASGLTVAQVKGIGAATASTADLSVAQATRIASAYASLGNVGAGNIGKLTDITKNYGILIGKSADDAQAELAKLFADPGKGAEEFAKQLGTLDYATLHYIGSLDAQGQRQQAISSLLANISPDVQKAAQTVGGLAKAWDSVTTGVSNLSSAAGRLASAGGIQGLAADRLAATRDVLQQQLDKFAAMQSQSPVGGLLGKVNDSDVAGLKKAIAEIDAAINKLGADAADAKRKQDNIFSLQVGAAIDQQSPEYVQSQRLRDAYLLLQSSLDRVNASGGAQSPMLATLQKNYQQLTAEVDKARGAYQGFLSEHDKAVASLNLQISAVGVRSPQGLADIARQQSLIASGNTGPQPSPQAKQEAELASTLARKNAEQSILDTQNQQLLGAQQRVDTARLELQILGQSTVEQGAAREKLQAKQQLEQEALRIYKDRDAYDRSHLSALERQIAAETQLKQVLAGAQLGRDIGFERDQIFRTSDEQQTASRLRGIYGDNFQNNPQAQQYAGQLRYNSALTQTRDLTLDVFKNVRDGVQQGQTLWQSLGNAGLNALNKLEDKAMEMALNGLFKSFAGSGGSAGTGGIFSLFSGLFRAGGGGVPAGQWAVVGEQGAELMRAEPGGGVTVFSNSQSTRMLGLPGFAAGGGFDALGGIVGPPSLSAAIGGQSAGLNAGANGALYYREGDTYHVNAPGATADAMAYAFREIEKLKKQHAALPLTLPQVWAKRPELRT